MIHRPFLIVVLALLVACLLGTAVVWRQFADEQVEQLREDRYRFSLGSLKAAAESGLRLGAEPGALPGIPALIAEIRMRQRDILSVDVFDATGQVRLSSDLSNLGLTEPRTWREPCLAAEGRVHLAVDDDTRLQCVALLNAFNRVAGGIIVRYGALAGSGGEAYDGARGATTSFAPSLSGSGLAGLLALLATLGATGLFVGRWATREIDAELAGAQRALEDGVEVPDSPLLGPVAPALRALRERRQGLQRADREIDEIDEIGTR